jgi:retron-type reverse transcriptase
VKKDKGSKALADELKIAKRKVKSRIRSIAKEKGSRALASTDRSEAWSFIRAATFTTKNGDNQFVSQHALNDYFATIVCDSSVGQLDSTVSCDELDSFQFRTLSQAEVERALATIKTKTAAGCDGISGVLLKKLSSALASNIALIFNQSLNQRCFPDSWKRANIAAVWKSKGSKSEPTNYRPISVLPVIARVFEKLIANQLYQYCDAREIIPHNQFGFRRQSSCEHALLAALDKWMSAIDQGCYVGALLVDFSKAFDNVPHQQLIMELLRIGCSNEVLAWFTSYLSERAQRVTNRQSTTPWKIINKGVPQGSCLSPLLFNIYVRDLPSQCSSDTFQFADDTTHSEASRSLDVIADKLTASFNSTKEFCDVHQITINAAKTQLVVFKSTGKRVPDDFTLQLDNCIIKPEKTAKLLGVILDQHLTLGKQIDSVVDKCQGVIGVLARAAPFLPRALLGLAYIALVRSHLEYCSSLYGSIAKSHLDKLDVVQRKAARIICGVARDAHSAPLLEALELESLQSRREKRIVKLVSSFVTGDCHPGLRSMFDVNTDGSVVVRQSKILLGRRRFCVAGAELFNDQISAKSVA